jgi:hypothetical protein
LPDNSICEHQEQLPKHANLMDTQLDAVVFVLLHSHFEDVVINKFNSLSFLNTVGQTRSCINVLHFLAMHEMCFSSGRMNPVNGKVIELVDEHTQDIVMQSFKLSLVFIVGLIEVIVGD